MEAGLGNMSLLGEKSYEDQNMSWSYSDRGDNRHQYQNKSVENHGSRFIYDTVVQGILVCLFTAVGSLMVLIFCLIIIQECKVSISRVIHLIHLILRYSICGQSEPTKRVSSPPHT